MVAPVYIITEQDIQMITPISISLDPKMTRPSVFIAQNTYLKPIVGKAYYDYLINAIATATTTAADQLLITNATVFLVYFTIYIAIPHQSDRIENKGIQVNNDDKSHTAAMLKQNALRLEYNGYAQNFRCEFEVWLIEYAKANPLAYPLYKPPVCTEEACRFENGIHYYASNNQLQSAYFYPYNRFYRC